jgi:hypothetical protein
MQLDLHTPEHRARADEADEADKKGATGKPARQAHESGALSATSPATPASSDDAPTIGTRIGTRVRALDWPAIEDSLNREGYALAGSLLTPDECRALAQGYGESTQFRSRVVMARHGFGRGQYQYYAYPLPALIAQLRAALYVPLARIANRWNEALGESARYPKQHADYLAQCHGAGQLRPTPLLLQYAEGDYNCLHQDLYGEHVFPLQVAILLSDGFTGGEFVMTEQRPRMQSRAMVVPLRKGDGVVFTVGSRPVQGTRGTYRVNMKHGVSQIRSGRRHTLGIIFHDAAV